MSLAKFLTSRSFLVNLVIAILLIAVILIATINGLKKYTRHGQANPVPDFTGLVASEIESTAKSSMLLFKIIDSVHVATASPGAVVEQVPEAGFKVKENRTVFLTINSSQPEKIMLPKLTDISFRQAKVLIENSGLKVGNISYQPSEYNDLVLRIQQDSADVYPGELLVKSSSIDLIIGRDRGNENTPLPKLVGLNFLSADMILTNAMLNHGVIIYDESITTAEDSTNAVIWRQYPNYKTTSTINLGSSVDLWFTIDTNKLQETE